MRKMLLDRDALTKVQMAILICVIVAASVSGTWYVSNYLFKPFEKKEEKVVLRVLLITGSEPQAYVDVAFPMYESTHPNVVFSWDIVPRDTWEEKLIREFTEKKGRYDLVWSYFPMLYLGGMTGGVIDLEAAGAVNSSNFQYYLPSVVSAARYRGTGPLSNKIIDWPPTFWNTMVLFYRKDLLEDPQEQAAFQAKYGHPLPVPPKTWSDVEKIAEFFNRPEDGLYGIFVQGGKGTTLQESEFYCAVQSAGIDNIVIEEGGSPKVLVTQEPVVAALEWLTRLTKYCPPGWQTMDFYDGDKLLKAGKVAMQMCWEYLWAELWDPTKTQLVGKFAWTAFPKSDDPRCPNGRHAAKLSAGGFQVTNGSINKEIAVDFIKWCDSYTVNKAVAMTGKLGPHPGRLDVAQDPEFLAFIRESTWPYMNETTLLLQTPIWLKIRASCATSFQQMFHKVASGEWTAQEGLNWWKTEIERVIASM